MDTYEKTIKEKEDEKRELESVIKNAEERISKWASNIYITRKEIARLKNDIYELDDEVAFLVRKNKHETSDGEKSCSLCFHQYSVDGHERACIAKCFHSFCYSCLINMIPKRCPTCKGKFSIRHVKKWE